MSSAAPASDRLRTTQHIDISPNLIKPARRRRRAHTFPFKAFEKLSYCRTQLEKRIWGPHINAEDKEEAKLKRLFQFRSAERDAETDQQRIGSIVQAINAAVELAQKERVALNIRVKEARDLASFAAGTGDDEYLTRETRDTSRLADYERQMIIGEKRIRRLDEQIASLTALQELSTRCFPDFMK